MSEAQHPSLVPPPEPMPVPAPPPTVPPAPLSRSMPPMPAIEPILEEATRLRTEKNWEGALEAYKKALFLVDPKDVDAQVSLYAHVAEVKIGQEKLREAETNFEKALALRPKHLRSIEGLIKLALQAEEWARVVTFRRKRNDALEDSEERVKELCRIAEVFETRLNDKKKAAETLELAGLEGSGDVDVLLRLRALYESMRAWSKLIDVLDQLCHLDGDGKVHAAYRFQQADVMLGRLRDEPRGLAFLELALDEDPQHDRALSALIAVRTRREEWAELATVYERSIERFSGLGDHERASEVTRKLAILRRDKLLDGPGAIDAFRGALALHPDDVESRAALAELYAAKGDRHAAVTALETAAIHAPFRAQTYRRLFDLHSRAQRPDRTWLIATCLEELAAADVAHELVVEQFRPDGPIRPTTAIEDEWWDDGLRAEGADPIVCDILRAISEAAIGIRLEELASKKQLPTLDPAMKQDRASTASVVRTFGWAARALGMPLPDLYLHDDVEHGVAAVPARVPSTALGPSVRSGLTVQSLAFVAGRHLTYYRPEHYALVFFPRLADLSALVLTAMRIVIPSISMPPPGDSSEKIARELGSRLGSEKKKALEAAVARLDKRGGRLDLLSWIRHVELTAARAGLLLAGDLRVAMRILKSEERSVAELTEEMKRGDLLAFTASEAYGELRQRMGVSLFASPAESEA